MRKLFTRESSQQAKEEQGNLFGVFFLILLLSMHIKQITTTNFFGFSKFFKHTRRKQENKSKHG